MVKSSEISYKLKTRPYILITFQPIFNHLCTLAHILETREIIYRNLRNINGNSRNNLCLYKAKSCNNDAPSQNTIIKSPYFCVLCLSISHSSKVKIGIELVMRPVDFR